MVKSKEGKEKQQGCSYYPRIQPVLIFPSERVGHQVNGINRSLAGSNLDSFAFYSIALRLPSYLNANLDRDLKYLLWS